MCCFCLIPFADEKQLLSGFPTLYQNKLQEKGVHFVNRNKISFELYGDLGDQLFLNLMGTILRIKTHITNLKIKKHQEQNTPMKMIQKTHEQAKLLQFPTLCYKYSQMMKLQKT